LQKLPFPICDDDAAIANVVGNKKLKSYPTLIPILAAIQAGYGQYNAVSGDAKAVTLVTVTDSQASWLKKLYKSPPAALSHLTEIRRTNNALPCSMCGSMHAETLDHVLPKDAHPSFAVFSKNLVPACGCNSKRGDTYVGPGVGARVLHPYYDDCLDLRLFAANFTELSRHPNIDLEIIVDSAHPNFSAIQFHLDSIIRKTGILNWMINRWTKFSRKPERIVSHLNFIPATQQEVHDALNEHLLDMDYEHGSKNNWRSMFASGLLKPQVSAWLFVNLSAPGRVVGGPIEPDI
jgi:hypothetical protein